MVHYTRAEAIVLSQGIAISKPLTMLKMAPQWAMVVPEGCSSSPGSLDPRSRHIASATSV